MAIKQSPRRIAKEIIDLSDHKRKEILCLLDTDTRIQVIEQLVDLKVKTARFGKHLASIAERIDNKRKNNV
mgnify:FL=1|tara:strand:+ start:4154 stop:4366 length:213 start_codon:yes stop_codon:yes gene_type:complete